MKRPIKRHKSIIIGMIVFILNKKEVIVLATYVMLVKEQETTDYVINL